MDINSVNPEFQSVYKRIPTVPFHNPIILRCIQAISRLQKEVTSAPGVTLSNHRFGHGGVRVYKPNGATSGAALLWIHGGGYIIGKPAINDRECLQYAQKLNLTVISVKYRLAPQHPFPAASDDCLAAWQWCQDNVADLGISPDRIVISGQSAGGGLAAGLVQRIHDGGGIQPAGQALFYPMLDDRTATRTDMDTLKHRLWSNKNNRGAWTFYLGQAPGLNDVPNYAAPARRENLSALPPTWLGVGDIDLFYEEDRRYAQRLSEAGVDCELKTVAGAPHAFDVTVANAPLSLDFLESNYQFLRRVLAL